MELEELLAMGGFRVEGEVEEEEGEIAAAETAPETDDFPICPFCP